MKYEVKAENLEKIIAKQKEIIKWLVECIENGFDYKVDMKVFKEFQDELSALKQQADKEKVTECNHPYAFVYRKMDFEKCTKCGKILCEG